MYKSLLSTELDERLKNSTKKFKCCFVVLENNVGWLLYLWDSKTNQLKQDFMAQLREHKAICNCTAQQIKQRIHHQTLWKKQERINEE